MRLEHSPSSSGDKPENRNNKENLHRLGRAFIAIRTEAKTAMAHSPFTHTSFDKKEGATVSYADMPTEDGWFVIRQIDYNNPSMNRLEITKHGYTRPRTLRWAGRADTESNEPAQWSCSLYMDGDLPRITLTSTDKREIRSEDWGPAKELTGAEAEVWQTHIKRWCGFFEQYSAYFREAQ